MHDGGEVKGALSAIQDVRNITRFDVVQSHLKVLEGYAAFIQKRYVVARRLIPDMCSCAERSDNDWALYEVMKLDMLLTFEEEDTKAGQKKYALLESWLVKNDLQGFLPNLTRCQLKYNV